MPSPLIQTPTIKYKTYVKEVLVTALRTIFAAHPDPFLQSVKVGIDYNTDQASFPAIVVRFLERSIKNAGVHHYEMIEVPEGSGRYQKFKHYFYDGSIEFAIYTLSSYDRDVLSNAVVQILTMGELEPYSTALLDAIYNTNFSIDPDGVSHMINLNTDNIQGFGESQVQVPWTDEDDLLYQTSYRLDVFGEFYSRILPDVDYGLVQEVEVYPYRGVDDPEPIPNPNPEVDTPWQTLGE